MKLKFALNGLLLLLLCTGLFSNIYGQIPEWYKGTPYKGKPQVIPGRIEFEYHDDGGMGVGFKTDYMAEGPVKEYRPLPHISVDETNTGVNVDKYSDGTLYPSAEKPHSYYVGWTHAGDWSRFTVLVTKTDDYRISSTFAEELKKIGFIIKFNEDSTKTRNVVLDYGEGDFHTWKKFDDIATVHLEAGLYVMQFEITITHLNYDYLEFQPVNK
jgi:hypothetical protein